MTESLVSRAHPIPAAALDQPSAIVGTVGAGKTFAAKSAVEPLLREGRRVIIIDPTGVWHGLRTMADGSPGFPVVIFGGEHADVPVSPDAGAALGALLAEDRVTQAIVDVSEMTGGERTGFLTAMLERLYAGARVPRHLIMDEADEMAPQQPLPEQRRLLGIVDKIVRRGRVRGFRPMMITQRPAVIHKNVLSQIATLVAMRLTSPQDRKAVEDWVKGAADLGEAKKVLTSLPRLGVGEGWVWAPREGILKRSRFPAIATLDTSATPDANAAPVPRQRAMARVDVAALRAAMAATAPATAAVAGPARRGSEVSAAPARPAGAEGIAAAEQRGYQRGLLDGEARGLKRGTAAGWRACAVLFKRDINMVSREFAGEPGGHEDGEAEIAKALGLAAWPKAAAASPPAPAERLAARAPAPAPARINGHAPRAAAASAPDKPNGRARRAEDAITLTGPQRQMLTAIAWWKAMGHPEPSRAQVAAIAGLKITSGHLKNVAGSLSSAGLITYPKPGFFAFTEAGVAAAPEPDLQATLRESLSSTLTGPQRSAVDVLFAESGRRLSRASLARGCGWEPTSGHVKNVIGSLSTLEIVQYPEPGLVELQDWVR